MTIIERTGRTAAGDIRLCVSSRGLYFCAGRLDGGFNACPPRSWRARWYPTAANWRVVLGPIDLMWTRKVTDA